MSGPRDSTRAEAGVITVAVTFFADLRRFLPKGAEGPQRYRLHEGANVADLLARIGITPDSETTVAVDGELAGRDTRLHDNADVMLLSPMEGGAAAEGEATSSIEGGAAGEGQAASSTPGTLRSPRASPRGLAATRPS